MKRVIFVLFLGFLTLSGSSLFRNKYETPSWIQGTWTNYQGAGDLDYDEWEFTSDNVVTTSCSNGNPDVFDYSEYGYREEMTDSTYKLISALGDNYWDRFTDGGVFLSWDVKQGTSIIWDNGSLLPK